MMKEGRRTEGEGRHEGEIVSCLEDMYLVRRLRRLVIGAGRGWVPPSLPVASSRGCGRL